MKEVLLRSEMITNKSYWVLINYIISAANKDRNLTEIMSMGDLHTWKM